MTFLVQGLESRGSPLLLLVNLSWQNNKNYLNHLFKKKLKIYNTEKYKLLSKIWNDKIKPKNLKISQQTGNNAVQLWKKSCF